MPVPEDTALLLFSSGSTGVPKGIIYEHKWLMGGSYFVGVDLDLTPQSRCLLRCSYVWSVSLYDLFPANMYGGTLVVPPRERTPRLQPWMLGTQVWKRQSFHCSS